MTPTIEDLEEFEDLTASMVHEWLRKEGWTLTPPERTAAWNAYDAHSTWEHSAAGACVVVYEKTYLFHTIASLASQAKRSPQALLRDINPRMRAGWPTDDELARHPFWVCQRAFDLPVIARYAQLSGGAFIDSFERAFVCRSESKGWTFWPCDSRGNKVFRGPARKRESESGK